MYTLGSGIRQETLNNVENEKRTPQDLEYCKKTEKNLKREWHTIGNGIWRETQKNVENEKCTPMTWIMVRKMKNVENEKCTLQ